jgi:hypothetical protein
MQSPLVKKDLVDAILELRADVEKQLQANKYYVALNKLDELLAAIRPLEIVEAAVNRPETPRQAAEPAPAAEAEAEPVKSWSGFVQETVVEGEAARP